LLGWILLCAYVKALWFSFKGEWDKLIHARPMESRKSRIPILPTLIRYAVIGGLVLMYASILTLAMGWILGGGEHHFTQITSNPFNGWTGKVGSGLNLAS